MGDFTNSKGLPPDLQGQEAHVFPENATESAWKRVEPLVTPEQLITRYLFGIPLVSRAIDPVTRKPMRMTPDMIKDYIVQAVSEAETELGLDIFPCKYAEKKPFDRAEYQAFGYFQLDHRPINTLVTLQVVPSNNSSVYVIPNEWVETAGMAHGQLNLIPLTLALVPGSQQGGMFNAGLQGGGALLAMLTSQAWVPYFFQIDYVAGFPAGQLPIPVNQLIGVVAAINILSSLAATYAQANSVSLSIDSMSQSVSTPGPQIFVGRIQDLEKRRLTMIKKLKAMYGGSGFATGNV